MILKTIQRHIYNYHLPHIDAASHFISSISELFSCHIPRMVTETYVLEN